MAGYNPRMPSLPLPPPASSNPYTVSWTPKPVVPTLGAVAPGAAPVAPQWPTLPQRVPGATMAAGASTPIPPKARWGTAGLAGVRERVLAPKGFTGIRSAMPSMPSPSMAANPNKGLISAGRQSYAARGATGNFAQRGMARYGKPGGTALKGALGGMAIGQLGNMGANMMGDNVYGNTASAGATGAGLGYMAAGTAPIAAAAGLGVGAGELLSRNGWVNDQINDVRGRMGFGDTNDTVIDLFDPSRGTPLGFIGGLMGVEGEAANPQTWGMVEQMSGGQVVRADDVRSTLDELEASGLATTDDTNAIVEQYNNLANQRVKAGSYTVEIPTGPPDPETGEAPTQQVTVTDPEQIRALTWNEAQYEAQSIMEAGMQAQQQQDVDMGRAMAIQQAMSTQLAPYAAQAQQMSEAHNAAVAPYLAGLPAQYQAPIAATSRSISDLNNMYANASIGAAIMAPQYQQYQQAQEADAAVAKQIQQMGVQYQLDQYRAQMYPSQSAATPTLDDAMMASLTQ